MTVPPTGTVTFLFTDIEGSTQLWERDREAMQAALEQHDALMRDAIEAHGGYVFKTIGDAFCAAFATAEDALHAAAAAQRALHGANWSMLGEAGPLRARVGVHTGAATERDGDYFGRPVNRVARLETSAHGGQILLSLATQQLVRDELPEDCTLRDWGVHRLKDLRHTEHIFQLEGPGLPGDSTPPTTAEALHPRDRVRVIEADVPVEAAAGENPWSRLEGAILSDDEGAEPLTLTPTEALEMAHHKPTDWREWRLGRIAEWSQPRYRLDGRFVGLTLLIDQGEESVQGRWEAKDERYEDLGTLLAAVTEPAVVILGPPGCGKSTLLRRLELDTAIGALRGEGQDNITFFIQLSQFVPEEPGQPLPAPGRWLSEQWSARYPDLPSLDDLLTKGNVTLLLDALNEMPVSSEVGFRQQVELWKAWLQALVTEQPGNRVVFSCRGLDYSQPLSTPSLRVPQVRIEPLSDEQVREFVRLHGPARWREIWAALEGKAQLEVLRSPYILALLVEHVEATGEMPGGRAALFTGFVRQALRREIERGNALFAPGQLLTSRDLRRVANWKWKSAYDLPERGILVPKLAHLALAMQQGRADAERSQVRLALDDALTIFDSDADEEIVAAGEALAVLDEDEAAGELMYIHQLVQEYFAARELARDSDPELVRIEWRADKVSPRLDEVIASLDPADPLPPFPGAGWEETTMLAATMASDPTAFLSGVMETNLALAGRAAAQPELLPLLPADLIDRLRWALVMRSRDPQADLRDRIACGYALGDLGDPRFDRRTGPHGGYVVPPLVEIPGGVYHIGDDEPAEWTNPSAGSGICTSHIPRHEVAVSDFRIGQFAVTNAEWSAFISSGGYEEERWWDTEAGRAWQRGELANEAAKDNNRMWRQRLREDPSLFQRMVDNATFASKETEERMKRWMGLDDEAFEHELAERWKANRPAEPLFWRDGRLNGRSQPVVGVCWYEARAYCRWLAAQTGLAFRLPSEVEWEAAARGTTARVYAYGDTFDRLLANTGETHVRRTTPVGVFPEGDTPEGVCDLTGNTYDLTASAYGKDEDDPEHGYPYDATDGREDPELPPEVLRVVRGGGWHVRQSSAFAAFRDVSHPDVSHHNLGFRLVVSAASPIL